MSMLCCMLALTPRQIKTLYRRPGLTYPLSMAHFEDDGVEIEPAAAADEQDEAAADEESDEADQDSDDDFEDDDDYDEEDDRDADLTSAFDEPVRETLEIHKSWSFLRALLLKCDVPAGIDPAARELIAGEEIGGDVGYGPAALRVQRETEEFSRFLQSVDLDRLLAQVNYDELVAADLYALPDEEALLEEIRIFYPKLREYVAKAAAAKHGLLVWLE